MPASLKWRGGASADLLATVGCIADDNPDTAQALRDEIEAGVPPSHPEFYKPGRIKGTREMVIRPSYVVAYRETPTEITILRVLHTARQRP